MNSRSLPNRLTDQERLSIAYQCLRKLWQIQDAGGVSMGRNVESFYTESAMYFIGADHTHSQLTDTDDQAFHEFVRAALSSERANDRFDRDALDGIDVYSDDYPGPVPIDNPGARAVR